MKNRDKESEANKKNKEGKVNEEREELRHPDEYVKYTFYMEYGVLLFLFLTLWIEMNVFSISFHIFALKIEKTGGYGTIYLYLYILNLYATQLQ